MKNFWICLFAVALFCSCSHKGQDYPYTLQTVDTFLNYHLASDVKVPLMIRSCIDNDGKEYVYFQNGILPELLIYDIHNEALVKRVKFKEEGPDAIEGGFLDGFMIVLPVMEFQCSIRPPPTGRGFGRCRSIHSNSPVHFG